MVEILGYIFVHDVVRNARSIEDPLFVLLEHRRYNRIGRAREGGVKSCLILEHDSMTTSKPVSPVCPVSQSGMGFRWRRM